MHFDDLFDDEAEMAGLWSSVKKVGKTIGKVAAAPVTLHTMAGKAIGKVVGGKKGARIGGKLGTLAGIAPVATVAPSFAAKLAGFSSKASPKPKSNTSKASKGFKTSSLKAAIDRAKAKIAAPQEAVARAVQKVESPTYRQSRDDNQEAAKVAAMLAKTLGSQLSKANEALTLAELQRTATYEHKKLMSDDEFRRKVLEGIARAAEGGNVECQRTVRVILGR